MNNHFARRVILDAVKQEIAKRYPDTTLRFSTIYQARPEMITKASPITHNTRNPLYFDDNIPF